MLSMKFDSTQSAFECAWDEGISSEGRTFCVVGYFGRFAAFSHETLRDNCAGTYYSDKIKN